MFKRDTTAWLSIVSRHKLVNPFLSYATFNVQQSPPFFKHVYLFKRQNWPGESKLLFCLIYNVNRLKVSLVLCLRVQTLRWARNHASISPSSDYILGKQSRGMPKNKLFKLWASSIYYSFEWLLLVQCEAQASGRRILELLYSGVFKNLSGKVWNTVFTF